MKVNSPKDISLQQNGCHSANDMSGRIPCTYTQTIRKMKKKVTSTLLICKTTSINLHFGVKMSLGIVECICMTITENDDLNHLCLKQGFLNIEDALLFLKQYIKAQSQLSSEFKSGYNNKKN